MSKRWKLMVAVSALLGAAALALSLWAAREPEFEGKPFSYYLDNMSSRGEKEKAEAGRAMKAMGKQALPLLIHILERRESSLSARARRWLSQRGLAQTTAVPLSRQQINAAWACAQLGEDARPAIPALAPLLNEFPQANAAAYSLAQIGPGALPALTNALARGSAPTRMEAAGALGWFRLSEVAALALVRALMDSDAAVRGNAAASLQGYYGPPVPLVKPMMNLLDDSSEGVRFNALTVLWKYRSQPEVLDACLMMTNDPAASVRERAVENLRALETAKK